VAAVEQLVIERKRVPLKAVDQRNRVPLNRRIVSACQTGVSSVVSALCLPHFLACHIANLLLRSGRLTLLMFDWMTGAFRRGAQARLPAAARAHAQVIGYLFEKLFVDYATSSTWYSKSRTAQPIGRSFRNKPRGGC
jgi:hypothetical protein